MSRPSFGEAIMQVYDSLLDVPLDEYSVPDGDDSLVPAEEYSIFEPIIEFSMPLSAPSEAAQTVVVPFFRLDSKSHGKPVRALNRALSVAGFRKWQKFSPVWNPWVTKALKNFQKSRGLPQTGVYNRPTHEKLAKFYDAYAIKHLLKAQKPTITKEQEKRQDFLAELMFVYNHRWNIYYTQMRPFDTRKPPRGLDCSASGEWACKWSEIPSPSGYSTYGYGNTWSQMGRLSRLGRKRNTNSAEIGDFVFYGRGGPTHVAYWIGGGRVWSFGSYPAKILPIYYRSDYLGLYDLMG